MNIVLNQFSKHVLFYRNMSAEEFFRNIQHASPFKPKEILELAAKHYSDSADSLVDMTEYLDSAEEKIAELQEEILELKILLKKCEEN